MLQTGQDCLVYLPSSNELELRLVFAYAVPVAPKSVLATLKWIPEDEDGDAELRAPWSKGLSSHYVYAPPSETGGLFRLAPISLPSRGRMEINLLSWPASTQVSPEIVTGLYSWTKNNGLGQTNAGLHRISEIGFAS